MNARDVLLRAAETLLHEARWRVDELSIDLIIAHEEKNWSYDKERRYFAAKQALCAAKLVERAQAQVVAALRAAAAPAKEGV